MTWPGQWWDGLRGGRLLVCHTLSAETCRKMVTSDIRNLPKQNLVASLCTGFDDRCGFRLDVLMLFVSDEL